MLNNYKIYWKIKIMFTNSRGILPEVLNFLFFQLAFQDKCLKFRQWVYRRRLDPTPNILLSVRRLIENFKCHFEIETRSQGNNDFWKLWFFSKNPILEQKPFERHAFLAELFRQNDHILTSGWSKFALFRVFDKHCRFLCG